MTMKPEKIFQEINGSWFLEMINKIDGLLASQCKTDTSCQNQK